MTGWLVAFAITVLLEVPIYVGLLRRWCGWKKAAGLGLLVNAVTHPALWFSIRSADPDGARWLLAFVIGELVVIAVEGAILVPAVRRAPRPELLAVAGVANLVSAGVGLLLRLR